MTRDYLTDKRRVFLLFFREQLENRWFTILANVRRDAGEQIESAEEQRGVRVHRRWVAVKTNYRRTVRSVKEIVDIERFDERENVRRHAILETVYGGGD